MRSVNEVANRRGWMAERNPSTRVYHYIDGEGMAICRGLGFYRGDLIPDIPSAPRGNEDCAKCFRKLRARQRIAAIKVKP